METAVVPVKTAWLSKVNWTGIAGLALSSLIAANPGDVVSLVVPGADLATKAALIFGVQGVQTGLTLVWRTWFNNTVTPTAG